MKFESNRLASGLFLEAIALCVIASFHFINIESTVTLLFFNFLFTLLTFELNGTLNRKLGMLALGNIIGLFWNFILYFFTIAGTVYFGEGFNVFYAIFRPFLNFMWIISFWSLSLAAFPKPKNLYVEAKP
ncbi:MAG TPA: hypothetical protein VI864_07660 [Candidatus Bathyarchaeia archaeon]|nr:hypothetical protein [Candidatus Bathyarchaeia archaeon]